MLFVINIGNTHIQHGVSDGKGAIMELSSIPTSEFLSLPIPEDMPVAAASVVPKVRESLSVLHPEIFWLTSAEKTGLDLSGVDAAALGSDRIANAIALAEEGPLPAICVDCGTAITFEAVSKERHFAGGAILPGRTLQRRALRDYTAQLPLAPLGETPPAKLGTNTMAAISLGIDGGLVGALRSLLKQMAETLGSDSCRMLAVGGDASFFVKAIPELNYGGEDFTLRGLAHAWQLNNKGEIGL